MVNNTLATQFPKLLLEWDWEINLDWNPYKLLPYSNKFVNWICQSCKKFLYMVF
jgi:hypothetical protein